jgi:hypothetical protein
MTDGDVSASKGSISIGGDANAPIINAPNAREVNLNVEQKIVRELPSFLGKLIAVFSQQSLSEYAKGERRTLPAEVSEKIEYNKLSENHRAIVDYLKHSLVLEKAYLGVEQTNADARYLVRRRAGIEYDAVVQNGIKHDLHLGPQRIEYVKLNADVIVDQVVARLLDGYKASSEIKVEHEIAHLAVSLVVADAVVECEVLERPNNAPTA